MLKAKRPKPCVVVIFGITGDLASRKLIPALFQLRRNGSLPDGFAILGVSRSAGDEEALRAKLGESVREHARAEVDEEEWEAFASRIHTVAGSGGDPDTYRRLREEAQRLDEAHGTEGNRLYYLAVAPRLFPSILGQLQEAGLVRPVGREDEPWSRVVIEKPLGHDLESSRELNGLIAEVLDEAQTYRIDHYLGKETVQNIMAFRFANAIFEPIWNRKHIEHIQVTAAESITVGDRGEFYDKTGVVRDVVQNHVLQILALCTMEPPVSLSANDVRDEKVQAIRSLHPIELDEVVMGQYDGYREVEGVEEGSRTPTFVAMKMGIDNWRWSGVPIYVRAGKAMSARDTHVAVTFRAVPGILFGQSSALDPNQLVLQIQPNEGISIQFSSKVPGDDLTIGTVSMDFDYARAFERRPGDAYERLLLDAMRGDATLFARRDEVEHAWAFVDRINSAWEGSEAPIPRYEVGEDGPEEARELLAQDDRAWRSL